MTTTITRRSLVTATAATAALLGTACTASNEQAAQTSETTMSLEQKISQMIMPALRSWDNNDGDDNDFNVIDLGDAPKLAEALRRHQYSGVILFGQNIVDTEQTTKLVHDLQVNNAQSSDAEATGLIPYFVAADQEGGAVARLSMGTRGDGQHGPWRHGRRRPGQRTRHW